MKSPVLTLLLAHVFLGLLGTQPARSQSTSAPPIVVGERLTYQLFWGPLVAGKATLEVVGIDKVDGHDCYRIKAKARTTGLADLLFRVESSSESWLDVDELCSRRFRQDRTEGKHVSKDETTFDYNKGQFTISNMVNQTVRSFPLSTQAVDVVACIYRMRSQPLALNLSQELTVNARRTNYVVNLTPNERRNIWVRPVGEVAALRIEPKPTLRFVAANNGQMWLWVSDDSRRLPLMLTSKMSIGTAKMVLDSIEFLASAGRTITNAAPRPFDFSTKH